MSKDSVCPCVWLRHFVRFKKAYTRFLYLPPNVIIKTYVDHIQINSYIYSGRHEILETSNKTKQKNYYLKLKYAYYYHQDTFIHIHTS